MRYKIIGESIVDTTTGRAKMTLSLPRWKDTLEFECKILNGLIVPKWTDEILIFVRIPNFLKEYQVRISED